MIDHRDFTGPGEAQARSKGFEKAESNTRWMWAIGFAILIVAGLFFAFVP